MDRHGTILVVDDDAFIRESLRRLLTAAGYTVQTADRAEGALEHMKQQFFDLVLTDWAMPGMDGLALLARIRALSADMPVVMLSGQGTMDLVIEALRKGVNDFIPKPYQPDALMTIVDREVQRGQARRSPELAPAGLGLYVSEADLDEIETLLATLRAELRARSVLLVESTGHAIATKGSLDDLNISALTALVAGDMAAASSIASLIGEGDAFQMNYHEGERYSVYTAQVTAETYLLIIFGQEVKLGAVLYYARTPLERLRDILTETAESEARHKAPTVPVPTLPSSEDEAPSATFPQPPDSSAPAADNTPTESGELYSLDEILSSGLLGEDALSALDQQFDDLWESDSG